MRTLITGGASSGKSTFAEKLLLASKSPRYYVATMRYSDPECVEKIRKHRRRREGSDIITIEESTDIGDVIFPERGSVLLECVCTLLDNEMFDEEGNERDVYQKIIDGIGKLSEQCDDLIVVTNEVGSAFDVSYSQSTLNYIRTVGKINCTLAAYFDQVYEMICGSAVRIK
jgi:adenosylcobinamide kinase/adenosylcobinamide-phosphate guanylyltransferase